MSGLTEFELIERYFKSSTARGDVVLGVGDDAAILEVPNGAQLVVSMDALVADVHFGADDAPSAIGHKAIAVNLSDMAAMGAEPAWATLALVMPSADEAWLAAFSEGLLALARRFGVQLVGGDTTRGPLCITIQLHGFVPSGQAIRRDGARPGDVICVTGTLGDAGLALRLRQECGRAHRDADRDYLDGRLDRPSPRVREGIALRGLASSAIDISDGLSADLGHILGASGVGAEVDVDAIPLSDAFRRFSGEMDLMAALGLALSAGDDYELCFTVPASKLDRLKDVSAEWEIPWRAIGTITEGEGLCLVHRDGRPFKLGQPGYEHFRDVSGDG